MFGKNRLVSKLAMALAMALLTLCTSLVVNAATPAKASLASLRSPIQVVVNSSFISPLVELFGDVSIGQKSFISGNTIVRADPDTKVCIGNETNLQDNILFLAFRNLPAPKSACGSRSSSTQERVSVAHQAVIKNSSLGNFTFVGFRS